MVGGRVRHNHAIAGTTPLVDTATRRRFRAAVLRWADGHLRVFDWRMAERRDPYSAVVVEVLLARTRADAVAKVFPAVMALAPDPATLAGLEVDRLGEVLRPLGLFRKRATALRAVGRDLVDRFGGEVPASLEQLRSLAYVGPYGANAVLCFAYGRRRPIVDANVERLLSRCLGARRTTDKLGDDTALWALAEELLPRRAADVATFNYALLDLGALVCRPRAPLCGECPLVGMCRTAAEGRVSAGALAT